MRTSPAEIVVSGWYGCGNVGDDALLDAIVAGFRDRLGADTIFHVLTEAPKTTAALYAGDPQIRPFPHYSFTRRTGQIELLLRGGIRPYLRTLRNADLFVLGGGGLVQDANGVGNLLRYLDDCLISEWLGTPAMVFGIGVGPLVTARGKWLTRAICSRVSAITARDKDGAQVLRDAGVRNAQLEATADPALLLEPATHSAPAVEDLVARMGQESHPIVICPRPRTTWTKVQDPAWEGLLSELAKFCEEARNRFGARILFIPFMGDDCRVIDEVRQRMHNPNEVWTLDHPPRPRDALRLISHARYVLGMRLHSLIFSASQAVPMISVNYAPKVGSFAKEVDPEGATFLENDFRAETALGHIMRWDDAYGQRRTRLTELIAPRKDAARKNFERAMALIGS